MIVARLAFLTFGIFTVTAVAVQSLPQHIEVTDGDTVKLNGTAVRLQGFNTPELHDAKCHAEFELAQRAKSRLTQLALSSGARVVIAGGRCGYGRSCGTMSVDGVDVGETLISEGLAERYVCKNNYCPPRRKWC